MRNLAIWLLLNLLPFDGLSQLNTPSQRHLTRSCRKLAKKEFIKLWKQNEEVSWPKAYLEANKLRFVPIPSFILSKEAVNYDSTRRIADFLIPNNFNAIDVALLFRKKETPYLMAEFNGTIDCSDGIFHNDNTPCHIDDSKGEKANTSNYLWKRGYELISERKYDFLFSVRYIRNCLWFIEKNKVFLLDLVEEKIYDPDKYIKLKCSEKIINDLAVGKASRICN